MQQVLITWYQKFFSQSRCSLQESKTENYDLDDLEMKDSDIYLYILVLTVGITDAPTTLLFTFSVKYRWSAATQVLSKIMSHGLLVANCH